MNIIEAMESKEYFRGFFDDLETWGAWQAYLKAVFGLPMTKEELRTYRNMTGVRKVPEGLQRVSYILSGRRSGKSKIAALISVFLATSQDWSKKLSPGERGFVLLIANDKDQARILKDYISAILDGSSKLRGFKSKEIAFEIELKNRVTISIRAKNYRALRGRTVIAAIFEELAFWRSEESANPDYEVLAAVEPAMLTIKDSMLIGISSVYAKRGLLFDQYKKYYGKSQGPLVWKSTTLEMNPTADKKEIAEQIKSDPAKYRAEYLSEFRGDIESYLGVDDLERITERGVYSREYEKRFEYSAFCDPSGGRVDSMTLGISHREKGKASKAGRAVLDMLIEKRPPFSPEAVVKEFSDMLKRYRISRIQSDRYAAAWVESSFFRNDIKVDYSELSASGIFEAFIPVVMNGHAALLDNKKLKIQFTNLERKTHSGGKDVIDHPGGCHDDLAVAAAGCLLMSGQEKKGPRVRPITSTSTGKHDKDVDDYDLYDRARGWKKLDW